MFTIKIMKKLTIIPGGPGLPKLPGDPGGPKILL